MRGPAHTPRTWHRVLRIVGDIRPGEGHTAARMFAAVFFVMCAYYMVKPLREGWIAASAIGGLSRMEIKAYSSLAQSLLLISVVGAYGRWAARSARSALITRTSLACGLTLIAFWLLQPGFLVTACPGIGIAFYLWVGMFGVFIVAQFWAFATDLYSDDRGRRLLPLIAVGGTAGATVGSWLHGCLTGLGAVGAHAILLAAVVPVALAALLSRSASMTPAVARPTARAARSSSFRNVLGDRFLLAAGLLALLLSWVTTNGENLLFHTVQENVARAAAPGLDATLAVEQARAATAAFYGDFYLWTNLAALVVQLLLTSRLLRRGGLAGIIFALPLLALVASAVVALAPALAFLKWVKVAEQATDYSLNQTARQVLWLPATAEMKYESKPTVDAIFVRLGDGLAALTMLAGSHFAGHAAGVLVGVNLVLVAIWILTAMVMVREHGKLAAARVAEARAALVPLVRRARRAVTRTYRDLHERVAAALRRLTGERADGSSSLIELLPIGRGHPPPLPIAA